MIHAKRDLKDKLLQIEQHDTDYTNRYHMVFEAVAIALRLGYDAGIGLDPNEPDWPAVVYIELPTGQVSWHMPAHGVRYDGHTTEQKYERIHNYK